MRKAMVRKQVYLTAELDSQLRREAVRQRRSEAEILREALAARLTPNTTADANHDADSLWDLVGIGSSSDSDLSERVDEILYGGKRAR